VLRLGDDFPNRSSLAFWRRICVVIARVHRGNSIMSIAADFGSFRQPCSEGCRVVLVPEITPWGQIFQRHH